MVSAASGTARSRQHEQGHPEANLLSAAALGRCAAIAGGEEALQGPPRRRALRVLGQVRPARQHAVDQAREQTDRADAGEGREEWRLRSREEHQVDQGGPGAALIGQHRKRSGEEAQKGGGHGDAGHGFHLAVAREAGDAGTRHERDAGAQEESVHDHVESPHGATRPEGPHAGHDVSGARAAGDTRARPAASPASSSVTAAARRTGERTFIVCLAGRRSGARCQGVRASGWRVGLPPGPRVPSGDPRDPRR